jgi:serine/threonine-protein kinase
MLTRVVSESTLAERLQVVLGDAYHLERELALGGMSHLFVATETSLEREVVIKVLPPELVSDVSAARFRQEIELAAHLQHPHVLSVLASGSKDELLYYVMPYVAGESLRRRLDAERRLSVSEAVRILHEMLDALAYAHRKGIVHRDIKPENILLLEGHALLSDFGVASARVAARGSNLTGTGTSVGTPAYMAPEQAAADPEIDLRADLYALAMVAYEMLTGGLPFSGRSAQAVLVAQMTEAPPPVIRLRPDVPAAVSAAIAKALAKSPDDRFASAGEFRDALNGGVSRGQRARWAKLVGLAAGVVAVALAGGVLARHRQPLRALDKNLIAVAPFNITDTTLRLWHEGMVDVLSRNLDGAGALRTVSPSVIVSQWTGRADPASGAALGRAIGAGFAVLGSLSASGKDTVRATVSLVNVATGRTLGDVIDRRDAVSHMDRLVDTLSLALLRALGRERATGDARLSAVGTSSLAALKDFIQGEQFFRVSAWDSAFAYYRRAILADSMFALPYKQAVMANNWGAADPDSLVERYAARVARLNHGLAPRDSILLTALFPVDTSRVPFEGPVPFAAPRRLLETLRAGVRRYPDDPEMWFTLGDAEYHQAYGPVFGVPVRETLMSLDKAIELDSGFTPAYIHAITIGFHYGRDAGRRYLAACLRHDPHGDDSAATQLSLQLTDPRTDTTHASQVIDGASSSLLVRSLNQLLEYGDSAETVVRMLRALKGRPDLGTYIDSSDLASTLAMHGLIRESLATGLEGRQLMAMALIGGVPPTVGDSLVRAYLATHENGDIGYWGIREDTARIHEFETMLKGRRFRADASLRAAAVFLTDVTNGYRALVRHDTTTAISILVSLPDSSCYNCTYVWLTKIRLLESHGRYAEAAHMLDQELGSLRVLRAYVLLDRGQVAERLGDRALARDSYSFVIRIWEHADASLQHYVEDARAGLKRVNSGTTTQTLEGSR